MTTQTLSQTDAISLTAAALTHVRKWMIKEPEKTFLRLGVKTTGCSGLAYVVELTAAPATDDYIFTQTDGLQVCVAPKSLPFIKGLQVDYVKQGLNAGFKYTNPNETSSCGCGESFTV